MFNIDQPVNELEILRLLVKNRGYYEKYFTLVDPYITSRDLKTLYGAVDVYYQSYKDHLYISEDDFKFFVKNNYPQMRNYEVVENLIEVIYAPEISSDTIKTYIHRLIEIDLYKQVADTCQDAILSRTFDRYEDIERKLSQFRLILKDNEESPFAEFDFDRFVEETKNQEGWHWRLRCLNEDIGPLLPETLGHIFARPECFSGDTEVLTPQGWRYVKNITYEDKIACVDANRNITFEIPSHIEDHDETEMYHIRDALGRVNLVVSGGHQMVYEYGGKGLRKKAARDIKYFQGVKHHVAGYACGTKIFTAFDALQIAYQADGHTRSYKEYGYTFSFKKQSKIDRLKGILNELGYEYTIYKDGNKGHTGFYVKTPQPLSKDFEWLNLEEVSFAYAQEFIEELSYWDATRRTPARYKFDTTNGQVADKVSALCSLANYNCIISVHNDTRKDSYKSIYSLSIRTKYTPVDGQSILKDEIYGYLKHVYCFTVSTGMLLVRRGGATAICGNTGKTSFLASEVTNFAAQMKEGETILWINNEQAIAKVWQRCVASTVRAPYEVVEAKPVEAKALLAKRNFQCIKFIDGGYLSYEFIQALAKEYLPKIIVIDQGDKLHFRGDNTLEGPARLKELYRKLRELAKETKAAIITVGQASGDAEGKKWLTMDMMDNSKVGKPGEMDWIIGIGTTNKEEDENMRFINIAKNKLKGKHGKHATLFDGEKALYLDMG